MKCTGWSPMQYLINDSFVIHPCVEFLCTLAVFKSTEFHMNQWTQHHQSQWMKKMKSQILVFTTATKNYNLYLFFMFQLGHYSQFLVKPSKQYLILHVVSVSIVCYDVFTHQGLWYLWLHNNFRWDHTK